MTASASAAVATKEAFPESTASLGATAAETFMRPDPTGRD